MFSFDNAKNEAEAKRSAQLCPEGKKVMDDSCSDCKSKAWCPLVAPSAEQLKTGVPDLLFWH